MPEEAACCSELGYELSALRHPVANPWNVHSREVFVLLAQLKKRVAEREQCEFDGQSKKM